MVSSPAPFDAWTEYFTRNRVRQRRIEAAVDWSAPCTLPPAARLAISRSFQRFELGESGEGEHLLGLAERAGDPSYVDAVRLLIAEEQRHSALFGRGLRHLTAPSLPGHWSDRVFTLLRRSLGLDTEIALFLVAETLALDWFDALTDCPDPVLSGIGRRIVADEREHVRFQIDRLHLDLRRRPLLARLGIAAVWSVVAVGAATVLVVGHAAAMRACGRSPGVVWLRGLRTFGRSAAAVLTGPPARMLGPSVPRPDLAGPLPRTQPATAIRG
jgi:hypothetical protein